MRKVLFGVLVLWSLAGQQLVAAPDSVSAPGVAGQKSGFLALPVIFYKPETHLAFGAVGIHYFHEDAQKTDSRASSIQAGFIYTQRNQIITKIEPQVYLHHEDYFVSGDLSFFKYPDKFYGIGNHTPDAAEENYTPQILRFRANFEYQIIPHLFLGGRYNFFNFRILKPEAGKELEKRLVAGSSGGTLSGFGLIAKWDTRNGVFAPSRGSYFEITTTSFQPPFGSTFTYNVLTADLRQYLSFVDGQTLALQVYGGFSNGNPPFQYMQRLGGEKLLRGYLEGRYLDRNYALVQAEYRIDLFWRIGMVLFGGMGDVAPSLSSFHLSQVKTSKGFGIRYAVNKEERLNIRIDLGFGQHGNSGFYLTAAEAF